MPVAIINALAAIAAARELHPMDIIKGLMAPEGTDRRFEYKGQFNGVTVIDDRAHHPTEIKATLTAAEVSIARSGVSSSRILTHVPRLSSTNLLMLFHWLIKLFWQISMLPVKLIRVTSIQRISRSFSLKKAKRVYYFPSFEEIEKFFCVKMYQRRPVDNYGPGDVVLVGEALIK